MSKINGDSSDAHRTDAAAITIDDVTQSYRRWAAVYDNVFGWVLEDGRRKLLDVVARIQPRSLLEMGVGTGLLLPGYATEIAVTGVDISAAMLAKASRRVDNFRLANVVLQREDCEALSLDDHSFDCVVIPYVLSVTPNPAKLISEAIRVCKPDGHIVIVNHFSGSRAWAMLERLAAPVAAKIGFRSSFSYEEHISARPLKVERVSRANVLGLSKLVVARPMSLVGFPVSASHE